MNRKIESTLICMLLIITAGTITATANVEDPHPQLTNTGVVWQEDFESYAPGTDLHGQGGWEGWDNMPDATAYVTEQESHSPTKSVDVADLTDLVHQFDGVDSGQWNLTCYQYIPSDFIGQTYFILLGNYSHGGPYNWATQIQFDSSSGMVISEPENLELEIFFDQWVELRIEIDFVADTQTIMYGGDLLSQKSWTEGVSGGGPLEFECLDLFANSASTVYYDDFVLEETETSGQADIEIGEVKGVVGITAEIKNVGDAEAAGVDWSITLDGGLILLGKEKNGTINTIPAGESFEVSTGLVFGIGRPTITITAAEETAEKTAFVLLFLVLGLK